MKKLDRYGRRYLVFIASHLIIQAGLFFLGAWTIFVFRAWIYFSVELIFTAAITILLVNLNPEVIIERGKIHQGSEPWDRKLVRLYMLIGARIMILVAGLDLRFQWSDSGPWWMIPGFLLYMLSHVFSTWAYATNRHFEPHVRIQEDRNHQVILTGPYGIVRHPGYMAGVLWPVAVPLILGSWAALTPGIVAIIILIYRTKKEDNFLQENLPGYREYAERVQYRLVPGIW